MKIGTLTYHDTRNYGAVLQAFALQRTIEKLGVDCDIIDYKSEFLTETYKIKSIRDLKSIKDLVKWLLTVKHDKKSKYKFDHFNKKYQKISSKIYTRDSIRDTNKVYDYFIVGSDQVWNLNLNNIDTTYFLDFVEDQSKKISYAASFGYKEIPQPYIDITKKHLCKFNNISVREEQGRDIVRKYAYKDSQVVLDPTLLLTKNEWSKISENNYKSKKDYILVYSVAATPTLFEFAKKLAKEKNCEIVYINRSYFNKPGMKNIRVASPQEFLGYIDGARYIITSSFHGVVFALNYEKDFFYELDDKPQNNNSRLESIIDIVNLRDREIVNASNSSINKSIDYSTVSEILQKERESSINFLKNIISNK